MVQIQIQITSHFVQIVQYFLKPAVVSHMSCCLYHDECYSSIPHFNGCFSLLSLIISFPPGYLSCQCFQCWRKTLPVFGGLVALFLPSAIC